MSEWNSKTSTWHMLNLQKLAIRRLHMSNKIEGILKYTGHHFTHRCFRKKAYMLTKLYTMDNTNEASNEFGRSLW